MFIINEKNWEVVKKTSVIGSNYKNKEQQIKKGDIIIIYNKRPISSIMGKFEVISNYVDRKNIFSGGTYPYRLKLNPIKILKNPIEIKPLIEKLDFIKNKKYWFAHLFGVKGLRKLSEKDFKTINNLIET